MNKFKKTIAVVAGLAFVLSLVVVPTAKADQISDLTKAIADATAQLNALKGTTVATPTFTSNLTIGSTGAEVKALQTWLIGNGNNIPAGATGYFGAQTKAALAAYQAAKGIKPAVGYFGPVTRDSINALAAAQPVSGGNLPAGCTSTTGYSPSTGVSCATGASSGGSAVADGQDGSVTLSYSPYVTSSQTVKKGETKNVYAVKFQATSGKVTVNRFDVHFSERPWLIFSQLTLKDSNGNVIATKNLSGSADATEFIVGTDYLVRFDNVNAVVTPGTDTTLVVGLTVSASSDKVGSQTVNVTVPTGSIRTINGKGYTDSLGLSNTNSITLTSTGSTGDLFTRNSPSAPDKRIVTTSVSSITSDVTLGIFSVKTQNNSGTINSLSININNSTGAATGTIFQNVRLVDGSTSYGANSLSAGQTTFTNLTIPVTQDTWKDLKVVADVLSNVTGVSASTTLVKSSIVGVDSNFNTITLTNASNVTSNDVILQTSGLQISNMSAVPTVNGGNGGNIGAGVEFKFRATNTGNSNIFISKVPGVALATSTTGSAGSPATASSTITYVTTVSDTLADDTGTAPTSGAYVIPSGGYRDFTYTGALDNTNGTVGLRVFKITQVNFGTSAATPTGSNVNFGLSALSVTPNLGNN